MVVDDDLLEGILCKLWRLENSHIVGINYYKQSLGVVVFKRAYAVYKGVLVVCKQHKPRGASLEVLGVHVGNYLDVDTAEHIAKQSSHTDTSADRVEVGVAVSHYENIGRALHESGELAEYDLRVSLGTLLESLGLSAEVEESRGGLEHYLVTAALKRHIQGNHRVVLSLLKRLTDGGDTHRYRERNVRVAYLDAVDVAEYAELVLDALREHLVGEYQQEFVVFVFADDTAHRGSPIVKKSADLSRFVLIVSLYVLSYLLNVVYNDVSYRGVVVAVAQIDLTELGYVDEHEHIVVLALRRKSVAIDLVFTRSKCSYL